MVNKMYTPSFEESNTKKIHFLLFAARYPKTKNIQAIRNPAASENTTIDSNAKCPKSKVPSTLQPSGPHQPVGG